MTAAGKEWSQGQETGWSHGVWTQQTEKETAQERFKPTSWGPTIQPCEPNGTFHTATTTMGKWPSYTHRRAGILDSNRAAYM